jgi:hypothetical protein
MGYSYFSRSAVRTLLTARTGFRILFKSQLHGDFMACAVFAFFEASQNAVDAIRVIGMLESPRLDGFSLALEFLADLVRCPILYSLVPFSVQRKHFLCHFKDMYDPDGPK